MPRPLTKRELEVALLAAEGLTQREIGNRLGTSINTVRRQVSNVYDKLGICGEIEHCRVQLLFKLNSDAAKPTVTELYHQLRDVAAERDGYRAENRKLREKLGEVQP